MGIYETTQLYLGLATIVAALTIIYYSRVKSATMDEESRKAFRPLYVVAIGLVVFALGALATFLEGILGYAFLVETYYAYYVAEAVEVIILGVAAAMILKARRFYAIPVLTGLATVILFYLAETYPQTSDFLLMIGVLFPAVILAFSGGLFGWIARETKRSTSFALAFGLITQIAGLPVLYFEDSNLLIGPMAIIPLFIVLMGPAMIVFSFLRPDQKVSVELLGYGASFAAPVLILISLHTPGLTIDPFLVSIAALGAISVLLAGGTSSYLYGRWKESRQIPTVLMMLTFLLFAVGHITGMLGNLGVFPETEAIYVEFILTAYALTFLAVGAIYAAGWKSAALIPMLIMVPISLLFIQAYPSSLGQAFLDLMIIVVPTIGIMLLPSVVFIGVWRRMRKNGTPGSLRPLGVAIGIILFFVIRIPPMVIGLGGLDYGYGLVILSFLTFWSALTGRLDRIAAVA